MIAHMLTLIRLIIELCISDTAVNRTALLKELTNLKCSPVTCQQMQYCNYDRNCNVYGDCCLQVILKMLHNVTHSVETPANRWQCQPVPTAQGKKWFYMVSQCPADYPDAQVSLRCAKTQPMLNYTYVMDVAAFSETSKTLYANIYCAVCHNDSKQITTTQLNIKCHEIQCECSQVLRVAPYVAGELRWHTDSSGSITAIYQAVPLGRKCVKYIDQCAYTFVSTVAMLEKWIVHRRLCAAYTNPVKGPQGIYKNGHCALCNGVAVDDIECYAGATAQYATPLGSSHFPMTFHFKTDGKSGTCSANQVSDSITGSCIDISCAEQYEMDKRGKCVPSGELWKTCPKIVVNQSDYTWIDDASIRVTGTDLPVFNTSSFEKIQDGSVITCVPSSYTSEKLYSALTAICLIITLTCLVIHILVHVSIARLRNMGVRGASIV